MADAGNRLHQAPDYQQLLEDLHALQQQNLDCDQQIQQLLEQLGPNGQPGGDTEANGPGNNPPEGDPGLQNRSTYEEQRCFAASAGRRAAIMHPPWMEPDFLFDHQIQVALPCIMEDVRKASLDPNDPEAGDEALADNANPSLYWAVYWFHAPNAVDVVQLVQIGFFDRVSQIRSDIVFHVAKNHLLIFGIATTDFCNKELHTGMEEVAELLRTFQFRFVDGRPNVDSFMKHPCIMKTIRYIYSGELAIATGARSLKARHAHSEIWQANKVTPSVVALAVTAFARLRLMEAVYEDHPDTYDDLMTYFNRSVLPTLYPPEGEEMPYEHGAIPPPDAGMTQLDVAFMEGL
ncbi:hypothetical protein RhiJN_06917 [Ceratobasidium sp. AG-Ba]|nr:hypothetical protein RhiJN_06917 [Ceratobasidium sp. AG-Ba]